MAAALGHTSLGLQGRGRCCRCRLGTQDTLSQEPDPVLTWAKGLVAARRTVLLAVANQGCRKALPIRTLEVSSWTHAAVLVTEVAAVVMPVAAVEVRKAVPYSAAELVWPTGRATVCKGWDGRHTLSICAVGVLHVRPYSAEATAPRLGVFPSWCPSPSAPLLQGTVSPHPPLSLSSNQQEGPVDATGTLRLGVGCV